MKSMLENMENGAASLVDDAKTSKCHISRVLRSLCQMLQRMKYHIYQPQHLVPNYTFLLLIPPFFFQFFHVQNGELTFAAPCIVNCNLVKG